jgi:hypothetical protein
MLVLAVVFLSANFASPLLKRRITSLKKYTADLLSPLAIVKLTIGIASKKTKQFCEAKQFDNNFTNQILINLKTNLSYGKKSKEGCEEST